MEKYTRYQVWDKVSILVTPIGEIYTPEQWVKKYPAANNIKTVCGGNPDMRGEYFGIFSVMVANAEKAGCDFSACESDQDYLDAIEAFEDAMNTPSTEPTAEERQAAALEQIAEGATAESTAAMNALLTGEEV